MTLNDILALIKIIALSAFCITLIVLTIKTRRDRIEFQNESKIREEDFKRFSKEIEDRIRQARQRMI